MNLVKMLFTLMLMAVLGPVVVTMALIFRDTDDPDAQYVCNDCVEMRNGGWHCAVCVDPDEWEGKQ